jgi:hypothetical protein
MATFPASVVCDTSTAHDGNMDFRFSEQEEAIDNRTRLLSKHGILYEDHIAMRCDHGDIISLVTSYHPEVGAHTQDEQIHSEVLTTQEKGLALMLFTADCQPTSFYDPITQTIALAHISRQTLCNKLSEKTVRFLQDSFCVDPANLLITIGPSIQKQSYAFPLPLQETHPQLAGFIEERDGMAHIDLVGAHLFQLRALGIKDENIQVSKEDTASPKYFSYYLMKKDGLQKEARMASILMMR